MLNRCQENLGKLQIHSTLCTRNFHSRDSLNRKLVAQNDQHLKNCFFTWPRILAYHTNATRNLPNVEWILFKIQRQDLLITFEPWLQARFKENGLLLLFQGVGHMRNDFCSFIMHPLYLNLIFKNPNCVQSSFGKPSVRAHKCTLYLKIKSATRMNLHLKHHGPPNKATLLNENSRPPFAS